MLTLEENPFSEWIFVHEPPDGTEQQLDECLELFNTGEFQEAEEGLRDLLLVCPDHIDALHHLALVFESTGRDFDAYLCTREAVRIGIEAMPSRFSWLTGRILWGHLANRPFMRAYHSLGLHLLRSQGAERALEIFARLVSINPNDNLGARYLLMQCFLDLADWSSAATLALRYPDDVGPDIAYSKVIALLHLGHEEKALESLKTAIRHSPNVAEELLKLQHFRPKTKYLGFVDNEAFDYWECNRLHWSSSSEAFKLLNELSKDESQP
jgi:tetratricopeptide (TPR) repeat protein